MSDSQSYGRQEGIQIAERNPLVDSLQDDGMEKLRRENRRTAIHFFDSSKCNWLEAVFCGMVLLMPSMREASKIRDIAARHAYVFDNGLCSPDFFDVEKRMASEEFGLLRERIATDRDVVEIGCFTGINLLGLVKSDQSGELTGIDFVEGAIRWGRSHPLGGAIDWYCYHFPDQAYLETIHDVAICFDVVEHQLNVGTFLTAVSNILRGNGLALFLVPVEAHYNDCGHVAWFPDTECLRNVLEYFFEVDELFELKTCRKMFASCKRRK